MNKSLKLLAHPYIFMLKEGNQIKENFLDFSLLMLQLSCPEIIRSPTNLPLAPSQPLLEYDAFPNLPHHQNSPMESGILDF